MQYQLEDKPEAHLLESVQNEKDIGVTFDQSLEFDLHIKEKVNKANSMFAVVRRSYKYLDVVTFKLLYKSLVRSQLEYASSVWSPYKIKHIEAIENVQRRATKQIQGLSHLPYEERLKTIKLPTLTSRRLRGDMIETFKILTKVYDDDVSPNLCLHSSEQTTHGHKLKLQKQRCEGALRLNSFPLRITNVWNNLPQNVIEAPSVNSFKNNVE